MFGACSSDLVTVRVLLDRLRPVVVALVIATVKASLVAMFFMHLKGERPMVTWPLALTAFLFVGLMGRCCSAKPITFRRKIPGCISEHSRLKSLGLMIVIVESGLRLLACPVCFGGDDHH